MVSVKYLDVHHARRQRGRGRHDGADRAGRGAGRAADRSVPLAALGVFGAALFYGDGDDHPGDLGALGRRGPRGRVAGPRVVVRPVALGDPDGLFAIQRLGTAAVGRLFGPIMGALVRAWLVAGAAQIVDASRRPRACRRPMRSLLRRPSAGPRSSRWRRRPRRHRGRRPSMPTWATSAAGRSARAWFWSCFPALMLNYLGQGALIARATRARSEPVLPAVARVARDPVVVLATAATLIASQAVISGAFSVTRQAVQLGFLPRLTIHHTSERGRSARSTCPRSTAPSSSASSPSSSASVPSRELATAYGIAVTGTLLDRLDPVLRGGAHLGKPAVALVAGGVNGFVVVGLLVPRGQRPKIARAAGSHWSSGFGNLHGADAPAPRGRELVTEGPPQGKEGPLQAVRRASSTRWDPPLHRDAGHRGLPETPASRRRRWRRRVNVEHNCSLHEDAGDPERSASLDVPRVHGQPTA